MRASERARVCGRVGETEGQRKRKEGGGDGGRGRTGTSNRNESMRLAGRNTSFMDEIFGQRQGDACPGIVHTTKQRLSD